MIRDARGSVSAEFAVTVPAVVVVIVLAVSALGVGGRQVRLEQGDCGQKATALQSVTIKIGRRNIRGGHQSHAPAK